VLISSSSNQFINLFFSKVTLSIGLKRQCWLISTVRQLRGHKDNSGPERVESGVQPNFEFKVGGKVLLYNKGPIDLYIATFTGNNSFYKDNNAVGFNQERCYYLVFSLKRIFFQSTFKYRP
jgi:hypothetical protein